MERAYLYGKERQTMSRIEDAVKKINLEIQKEPDNGYIAVVGEYIID